MPCFRVDGGPTDVRWATYSELTPKGAPGPRGPLLEEVERVETDGPNCRTAELPNWRAHFSLLLLLLLRGPLYGARRGPAGGAGMRTGTRGIDDLFAGKKRSMGGRKKAKVRGTVRKANRRQIRSKGSGTMDKAAIAKVVSKNIGQVRYCYERTLLKSPNLRGKVVVQWTIAPTGRVRSASTQFSSVTSDSLTRCILGKIKKWKFPKPKGGQVIVSYPFIFNSVGF